MDVGDLGVHGGTDVIDDVVDKKDTQKSPPPTKYNVIMHNDDYTPMDFVTWVLRDHFNKPLEQAIQLMLKVHNEGKAIAGTYSKDVANTKVTLAMDEAKRLEHPFRLTIEPQ